MRDQQPRWSRCTHCDARILEVRYGAGYRWEHIVKVSGVYIDAGTWCQLTQATPGRVTVTHPDQEEMMEESLSSRIQRVQDRTGQVSPVALQEWFEQAQAIEEELSTIKSQLEHAQRLMAAPVDTWDVDAIRDALGVLIGADE